jgi:LPXTG-site transpeptidase (sortase) family protein
MTTVIVPGPDAPALAQPTPGRPPGRGPGRRAVSPATVVRQIVGASLIILALSGLGYVVWVALFSSLHYDKAQLNAYDTLRYELAEGDAPNGPTAPNNPSQPLAAGSPVAVMGIPAIGLRTVILQGTTSAVLENGPGHLRDTPMPGQAGISVILGRKTAYGGPFGKLASLVPGDSITVVTGQTVAGYEVIDLRRAGSPLPAALAAGAGRMILVTSDGTPLVPSGMLYVDAALTSKPQPAPAMVLSSGDLSASENAMGTEPQAWLPIVFWGQLLLIAAVALSWLWNAWGRWQTWLIAVPIIGYIVLSVSDEVTRLLPNLM